MKKRINKDFLLSVGVFWAIIASGSQFFMNQNMILTDLVMLLLTLIILIKTRLITKSNRKTFTVICLYLLLNTIVNITNGIYTNDVIIVLTKLLFVMVLASNLTLDSFIVKYVRIMLFLSALSLVCFVFLQITKGGPLPFQIVYQNSGGNIVYSTFYHTVGWQPINGIHYYTSGYGYFTRNAGIFWEPGAYQIFLNLALFFYVSKSDLFNNDKHQKLYIPLIVVTIISTLSTTAFICLLCNLLFYLLFKGKCNRPYLKGVVIIASLFFMIIIEKSLGIIEEKLINHGASYITRLTDTSIGFALFLSRPFLGYGIFSKTYLIALLNEQGIVNISNGLVAFLLNVGLVGGAYYLWRIIRYISVICKKKLLLVGIIFVEFILMACSESIMLAPVFLIFLFSFGQDRRIHN